MPTITPAEWLLYTTFRLACYKGKNMIGSGTGFFYQVPVNEKEGIPLIVTNKHVIEGCDRLVVYFHEAKQDGTPSGQHIEATINLEAVFNHPDVDLCAMGIADLMNQCTNAGKPILFAPITRQHIPNAGDWQYYDAIEEVTMIGCPNGLFDEFNKMPLVRRGITATALGKDYEGSPEFLVDMACFPGSSGSPVFLFNRDGYYDRKTNSIMMGQGRMLFVGVLFEGPLVTNEGKIVLTKSPKVEVQSMMHLGCVVKSSAMTKLEALVKAGKASKHST